jgi:uncharacterized protein YdeI (YjbR/CyaY-like superfamily)
MEAKKDIPVFYAKSDKEWRQWLQKNSQSEKAVRLLIYHKKSKTPGIHYEEAMEQALCFGWIDGRANKHDEESFYLYFTQRKPKSNWSKINKQRAAKMIKKGLMTPGGQAFIDLAKKTGTWDMDNDVVPADLQKLFAKNKTAFKNFQAFAPSSRRLILQWVLNAKQPATRLRRMTQTVELAAKNIKANHPK